MLRLKPPSLGTFNGWDGETIFNLDNGQVWQQSQYDYMYS